MCADNWVNRDDWLAADNTASGLGALNLLDTGVSSFQAMKSLLELWGESVVRLDLVDKDGVTTSSWLIKNVEEGSSWWLQFVGDIRVPCNRRSAGLEKVGGEGVTGSTVDEMDLWKTLWRAGGWVDVVAAEVFTVLECLVDGEISEILVAEGNDFALGDETGKLVLASVGEGGELDALDFSANGWGEVDGGDSLWEEVLVRCICVLAVLVVLECGQWTVLLLWVEGWEVVLVLYNWLGLNSLMLRRNHTFAASC